MSQADTLASLQARFGERYRWLLLLSVMIGTMASVMSSVMSSTIINVAVPDMSRYFVLVLLARVAEGLASGVVQPIPAIIILHAFSSSEQARTSRRR